MEDLDALDFGRFVEALDDGALGIAAGITLGGHHHRERSVGEPAQIEILQLPVGGGEQGRHEVRHQAQHQHLAFGIAEADIVFDQLRPRGRDHQSEIEHALERSAHLFHRPDRGQHEFVHSAAFQRGCHHRHRRIGAHAAGVGTSVAVEHPLVILRGNERDRGLAVAQREERCLLAFEMLLDHHLRASRTEPAAEHHVDRGLRLGERLRHHHPLAGGEPVGLDHDRSALGAHIGQSGGSGGKSFIGGSRDAVFAAQILGEALGGLELGGGPACPEGLDAGGGEVVHDAGGHRRLRPDHHEIDPARTAERDHRRMIAGIECHHLAVPGDTGIAGRAVEPLDQGACSDLPGQCVLAPAGADEKDIHA